ncbi:MAG: uracil-DNA glycosylase [Pseudomonadota bacterium]
MPMHPKLLKTLELEAKYADEPQNLLAKTTPEPTSTHTSQEAKLAPKITTIAAKDKGNITQAELSRNFANNVNSIEQLVEALNNFEGCNLKHTSTNTVVYDGVTNADVMLIGEAPGANEDLKGIPFCGDSGQLMDVYLNTINLARDKNIFITNSVYWRPPANRKPTASEMAICLPWLEKTIALVQPKIIILIGAVAVQTILNQTIAMAKIRRRYFDYSNSYLTQPITTTALYHPSYLLRSPGQKKTCWFDLLHLEKKLYQLEIFK